MVRKNVSLYYSVFIDLISYLSDNIPVTEDNINDIPIILEEENNILILINDL